MAKLIVTLDEIRPLVGQARQLIGGKALNLAKLKQAGFNVPNALIITTTARGKMDNKLKKEISEHLKSLKDSRFAVRSSATVEDSEIASFAGQMESYLSTPAPAIFTTVEKCWQSLRSERVRLYCQQRQVNFLTIKMAVIIQEMIFAEKGGVIFTENIFQHHQDELMMEAAQGLGEKVVSGLVNPERIIVKKTSKQIVSRHLINGPILTDKEVTQLVEIALKIEALYRQPQDIEWAIMKNKIYLLQSRPITK